MWDILPTEIIFEIFQNTPIQEILSLTSCCRSFYDRFGNISFLSSVFRARLRHPLGSMHWFMPVSTVEGEIDRFCEACKDSIVLENKSKDRTVLIDPAIVFAQEFPLYEFVRENYLTESMRNRRRLWRISQQFRREWYRYRTKGYLDENPYKPDFPV
jgi:hypothetical protein